MSAAGEQFNLAGRVVILTGGAGLLGRDYAHALAEAGAHVVVADINGAGARSLVKDVVNRTGVKALAVAVDVSRKASVQSLAHRTMDAFGRVDVLVNNAAIDPKFDKSGAGKNTSAFEEYPLELWNRSLAVNVTGMFLCAQAVAPAMLRQRSGTIINVSSIYGMVGPDQRLYEKKRGPRTFKPVDYTVTKSAVIGLTKYLATYWAGKNIRVNTLTLGGVFNEHDAGFVKRYSARTTLGRMARQGEYCGALVFLASDAASYLTGANVVVDGGWTAW